MDKCGQCNRSNFCRETYHGCNKCDVLIVSHIANGILTEEDKNSIRFGMPNVFGKQVMYLIMLDIIHNVNCLAAFNACLSICDPKYVITLGKEAYTCFTGMKNYKRWVGRNMEVGKFIVIPIHHPSFIKTKERQREANAYMRNAETTICEMRSTIDVEYVLFDTEEGIESALNELTTTYKDMVQAFDYETTGLDERNGSLVCMSVSFDLGIAWVLYFFDKEEWTKHKTNSKLTHKIALSLKKWMLSGVKKVAHSAKFESIWTMFHIGCEPVNLFWDTKQCAHLIDENSLNGLKDLAYQFTDMGGYDTEMERFLESGFEHWQASKETMIPYSGGDADCTLRIYMAQKEIMNQDKLLYNLFTRITMPTVIVLSRMETRGMCVNKSYLKEVLEYTQESIEDIGSNMCGYPEVQQTLRDLCINKLNLNSPKQMVHLLYSVCKLPVYKKSAKTNVPSTDEDTLIQLTGKHAIIDDLLKIRDLSHQLIEVNSIIDNMHENTISTNYLQDFVVTGRLSSRKPNLQNLKGETEGSPSLVKRCFISRFAGGILTQVDYDQLELKLVGSESEEPEIIKAFENGMDLHSVTGSAINDIPIDEFLLYKDTKYKKMRFDAKRVNFGCIYNITEYGLAKELKCSVKEAKNTLEKFWNKYPYIQYWMGCCQKTIVKDLQIRSKSGRIRRLPNAASNNKFEKEAAIRQGVNFCIANLGAEITMWSMNTIDRILTACKFESCVVCQVHDSIVIDTHPNEKTAVASLVYRVTNELVNREFSFLKIPLSATIETGDNWADMEKLQHNKE